MLLVAAGFAPAVAQPVTVGIVENQTMIPAGTYVSGVWRRTDRQRPPEQGALWGESFQGQTVHPVAHREDDGTLLWRLDIPEQPQYKNAFGLVISPARPVTVFRDVSSSETEKQKIEAFLGKEIQSQLDSRIAEGKAPAKRIERQPPVIRRTESAIGGVTYYYVRSVAEVITSDDCEEQRFVFGSWVTESPEGHPQLVSAESKMSCYGSQATYLNPLGAFRLGESVFAIGEEAYYEGASAVIMNLSPQSIRVLLRNHWTQD